MDKVQLAQRNEYPHSIELDSIPRELLEMICHFLNSEDLAQLSGVNHSLNMSLSQRAVEIGKAGIVKALSDGRADQAFSMLTSFCKWLGSAHVQFSLNEKLQIWESLLDCAGHASLIKDQQSSVFRQIYFSACQTTDPVLDEVLQLMQHIRAKWFCKFFNQRQSLPVVQIPYSVSAGKSASWKCRNGCSPSCVPTEISRMAGGVYRSNSPAR